MIVPWWYVRRRHGVERHPWYPTREQVQSISPNAISPYDWGYRGSGNDLVDVPIWHVRSAAYFIGAFPLLAGYLPGPAS